MNTVLLFQEQQEKGELQVHPLLFDISPSVHEKCGLNRRNDVSATDSRVL